MPFNGTGTNLLNLITVYANGIGSVFMSLDGIQFFDAPFSILDVIVALLLFKLITWFIIRIITQREEKERINAYTVSEGSKEYASGGDDLDDED